MSQYMYFFIKDSYGGDHYIPIKSVSRSSELYQLFQVHCGYGAPTLLDYDTLCKVDDTARNTILELEDFIGSRRELIEQISKFENSVAEKLEQIAEEQREIDENEDIIEELREARSFIRVLQDMLEAADEADDADHKIQFVFGIECYEAVMGNAGDD